mmetsp:Transcript_11801/g.27304  ORF Transcript_11801/g.27304 Transcript_11801/m.27304 type:complete len:81 (+) Transcript_11801:3-245(+)
MCPLFLPACKHSCSGPCGREVRALYGRRRKLSGERDARNLSKRLDLTWAHRPKAAHPATSISPPMGVIAPSFFCPVRTRA